MNLKFEDFTLVDGLSKIRQFKYESKDFIAQLDYYYVCGWNLEIVFNNGNITLSITDDEDAKVCIEKFNKIYDKLIEVNEVINS